MKKILIWLTIATLLFTGFALAERRISVDALDDIDRRADQEGGNGRDRGSNGSEDDDIHRPGRERLSEHERDHVIDGATMFVQQIRENTIRERTKRSEPHQQEPDDEGADPKRMTEASRVFVA